MALLDFHGKNLLPSVWSADGELTNRFRAQLADQMKRFPNAKEVLLVGDTVSHYWMDDSDVDILLKTPEDHLVEYQQQAKRASGFPLSQTENEVYFHVISDQLAPSVIARYFGPVYSASTGLWYGKHVTDEMELVSPDAVENYINWRLYKAKYSEDPFPDDWYILAEAFTNLSEREREVVLDRLRQRVKKIDANVRRLLKKQSRAIWRAADQFEEELIATEETPSTAGLPLKVAYAILHKFRYQDVLDTLIEIDEQASGGYDFRFGAADDEEGPPEATVLGVLKERLDQLITLLIQREGGFGNAVEVTYKLFRFILENNRYIATDIRRRRIVYRLYRRYYQRAGE